MDDLKKCSFKPKINMKSNSLFKCSIQSSDFYVRTMRWKKIADKKLEITRDKFFKWAGKKARKKPSHVKKFKTRPSIKSTQSIPISVNFSQTSK